MAYGNKKNESKKLTLQEWRVFFLFGKCMDIGRIAKVMRISNKTVSTYTNHICTKVGVKNRIELFRMIAMLSHKSTGA